MKKLLSKKSVILVTLIFNSFIIYCQNDFLNFIAKVDSFWVNATDSIKEEEGSGYVDYIIQKSWLDKRFDENGTFAGYNHSLDSIAEARRKPKTLSTTPWSYKGPFNIPPNGENDYQSSKGWIWSCLVNPNNHNQIYVSGAHGGIWKTIDGGANWTPLTDMYPELGSVINTQVVWGGGVNGADIIYALTATGESGGWAYSNGVFKSNDGGTTWSNINNGALASVFPSTFLVNLGRKIIIDPTNNQILYLITFDHIYKTTDGGNNWVTIKSDNFNWYQNYEFGWFDIEIMISGSNKVIFVSGYKQIKSTDGGNTWTDISMNVMGTQTTITNVGRSEIAVDNTNYPGRVYFFFNNGNQKITEYNYTNDTYTTIANFGSNGINGANINKMEIEISPTRSIQQGGNTEPFLYISGWQVFDFNLYRTPTPQVQISTSSLTGSLDGPGGWVHDDIRCMQVLPESGADRIFVGNDGGFSTALSNNSNCSPHFCWSNKSGGQNGLHCNEFFSVSTANSDNELLMGGMQDCGVFVYNDLSTNKWIHSSAGDGSKASLINPVSNNIMFTTDFFNHKIRRSTTTGLSFFGVGASAPEYTDINCPLKFRPGNPAIMYLGQGNGYYDLKRYTNASTNWNYDVITPTGNTKEFSSIGVCESNPDVLYVSNINNYLWNNTLPQNYSNCIWRTSNSYGNPPTWVDISSNLLGLTWGVINDIAVNPYNENEIWVSFGVATSVPKVYKGTWNNGMTWVDYSNGLPNRMPVSKLLFDKTNYILYAATDAGIYYCDPKVTPCQWSDFSSGLPFNMINDMDINYAKRKIYAATFGRGLWENSLICNNEGSQTTVSTTTTWGEKYLTGNLVVSSGATLTINTKLGMSDGLSIDVQAGCTLILNGEISSNCNNDGYWNGNLIVEPGGILILNSNSTVKLEGTGKIFINGNTTISGVLSYYSNANIILKDNNTMVDITGILNIHSGANFTFTGAGYLRLSSPNNPSNNITYGTGSSITLNGSGKTDKILEIAQETAYMPNCTITNGLVYMQNSIARMQAATETTTMDIEHVKFSPLTTNRTNHRGLQVWGNSSCTIIDCDFENGQYGIYGWLSYGGAPLSINNCTFTNNWAALWIHDKAMLASNCTFSKNTYGYYAEFTSFNNNLINNCVFAAYPNGNTNPVMSNHCTGDILMENSQINYASPTAVYASGSHTFSAKCSDVSGLTGGAYAFNIANGTTLNVSSTETSVAAGNCHIVAGAPLRFTQANYFYIDNGYNYLSRTGDYHIYGTLTKYGCVSRYPIIYATHNQWVSTISNLVTKYNCSPTETYTIDCSNPITYSPCGSKSLTMGDSTITAGNATYSEAFAALKQAGTSHDYNTPFNLFGQILAGNVPQPNMDNVTLWENSWENMRFCLKEMYRLKQLTGYSNSSFLKTIAANDKMQQLQADNYYRKFQLALDKATLYRMAGDYNTAISLVSPLTADTSASNQRQADDWLCILNIEKRISDGSLPPNQVAQARAECSVLNEPEENKSLLNMPDTTTITFPNNASWLKVIPNPAKDNAVICVNAVSNEPYEVEITTILGNPIETISVQGGYSETPVSFSKYSQGVYIVSLKKNGQVIAVSRLTVNK
jgi:hypothetical protein